MWGEGKGRGMEMLDNENECKRKNYSTFCTKLIPDFSPHTFLLSFHI